jgi:hypothetical protein
MGFDCRAVAREVKDKLYSIGRSKGKPLASHDWDVEVSCRDKMPLCDDATATGTIAITINEVKGLRVGLRPGKEVEKNEVDGSIGLLEEV